MYQDKEGCGVAFAGFLLSLIAGFGIPIFLAPYFGMVAYPIILIYGAGGNMLVTWILALGAFFISLAAVISIHTAPNIVFSILGMSISVITMAILIFGEDISYFII